MNKYTKNFEVKKNYNDIFCFAVLGILAALLIVTVYVVNTTLI